MGLFGGGNSSSNTTNNTSTTTASSQGGPTILADGSTVTITDGGIVDRGASLLESLGAQQSADLANLLQANANVTGDALYTAIQLGAQANETLRQGYQASLAASSDALARSFAFATSANGQALGTVKDALASNDRVVDRFLAIAAALVDNAQSGAQKAVSEVSRAYLNVGELKTGQLANAQQYIIVGGLAIVAIVAFRALK